jgi:hypothetical protein
MAAMIAKRPKPLERFIGKFPKWSKTPDVSGLGERSQRNGLGEPFDAKSSLVEYNDSLT